MGSFEGPNSLFEPVEELEIIGKIAKERLAEMHVGLHEAWNHELALEVYSLFPFFLRDRAGDLSDSSVFHAQASTHDAARAIGEQKEAAFAAKKVILTAEEIVDESVIRSDPNRTMIPG